MFTYNGQVITNNHKWLKGSDTPPTPPGPSFDEVTIGNQTWMAKNLAIDDGGTGIYVVDDVSANGVDFGTQYYYSWTAAKRLADSIDGWHLPSENEYQTLINYVGGDNIAGKKLKSTTGWYGGYNGTDDYGLCVLPVGYYGGSSLYYAGSETRLWTSSQLDRYEYGSVWFRWNHNDATFFSTSGDGYSCSVRLVKDS